MDLLDQMEPQGSPGQSHSMSEKMAINAIQKSLMQCETVVKSPTYTVLWHKPFSIILNDGGVMGLGYK